MNCLECPHREPLIWKNRAFQLYQQYTRLEELETWDETKALAEILKQKPKVLRGNEVSYSDGFFNYQIRFDGFVVRIPSCLTVSSDSMKEPHKESARKK